MYFILQDRYEKELNDLRHDVEDERAQLQEAEVLMIRNLEETVELSTQRLHRLKRKKVSKVSIKIYSIYQIVDNELAHSLVKIFLVILVQIRTTLYCL